MIKRLVMIAAVGGLLVGCTAADKDDTFATMCATVSAADVAFNLYAATGKVRQSVVDAERKAVAGVQAVCSGPRPQDTRTAIAAVSRALTAIATETARARQDVGKS